MHRVPAPPRHALTLLSLVLAALVFGPSFLRVPAGAQEAPIPPTGQISLASQTSWVTPDGVFELRVDLARVRQPDALALEISVHGAVTSRSQFRRTLDGDLLGEVLWRVGPTPLPAIELDDAGAVPISVPLADGSAPVTDVPALLVREAGVHPVRVVLRDTRRGAEVHSFTTYLVRSRQDDAVPLAVAWIQPLAAPPAHQPDTTVALDPASRRALDSSIEVISAVPVPLTVVPRPETLEALALLAPETVDELSRALVGRQVVAGPYVDVDVAALLAADLGDVVDGQRAQGVAVIEDLLGPADRDTWVSPTPLDVTTLARVSEVPRLVLPEGALVPLDGPLTLANPFVVEGAGGRPVEAAAVDPQIQSHFTADDPVLGAHHLLADLAVLAYDAPGLTRGVVVTAPEGTTSPPEFLATALAALDAGSVVRPVTLDTLFATVPLAPGAGAGGVLVRELASQPPPAAVDGTALRQARADTASFATMVGPADASLEEARRLLLLSSAASLPGERRDAYLAGADQVLRRRLGDVGILSEGSFRLTSRRATIPLTLVNALDVDVDVVLTLDSDKLDFVGAPLATGGHVAIPLRLRPGNTPVMVPVEARTSGDFPLFIDLRSPDGRLQVADARLTVRSTSLSGVGVLASAGAGLFLVTWWARHWRSVRRDRRLIAPPPDRPSPPDRPVLPS